MKKSEPEDELDRCATTITLAQAIEVITAAGGTVIFGDTGTKQIIQAAAAKQMEDVAKKS